MDTDGESSQPDAMTPFGKAIAARMEKKGWSAHEVARRGGPAATTINRLISRDPTVNRNPPRDRNLVKLATVLGIPSLRLRRLADETLGLAPPSSLSEYVDTIDAALFPLTKASQEVLADVVVELAGRLKKLEGRAYQFPFDTQAAEDAADAEDARSDAAWREYESAAARDGVPLRTAVDAAEPDPNVDPPGPEAGA